jgi:hypothetical protein
LNWSRPVAARPAPPTYEDLDAIRERCARVPEVPETEAAVAAALARDFNMHSADGIQRLGAGDFAREARTAVAVARPAVAAEELFDAARSLTDRAADLYRTPAGPVTAARIAGLNEAAAIVRSLAEQHRAAAARPFTGQKA